VLILTVDEELGRTLVVLLLATAALLVEGTAARVGAAEEVTTAGVVGAGLD
jgi:hypothetical protein